LVLAGLSLQGRRDPSAFIASFCGDDRHVTDLLGVEVLQCQPEHIRRFLLRTSVLERLSGPLCDAVLESEGSAKPPGELVASKLNLVPLDDQRQWYRYPQLFAELLRLGAHPPRAGGGAGAASAGRGGDWSRWPLPERAQVASPPYRPAMRANQGVEGPGRPLSPPAP